MDELLAEMCLAGRGVVSAGELARAGVPRAAAGAALRSGRLVRVGRGLYVETGARRSPEAWHALRARALLSRLPEDVALTHHSALVAHGLPTHGANLDVVHLGRVAKKTVRRAEGRVWHRLPLDTAIQDRVVAPAFAVVQVGLGRPRAALVAADQALRRGRPELLDWPDAHRSRAPRRPRRSRRGLPQNGWPRGRASRARSRGPPGRVAR